MNGSEKPYVEDFAQALQSEIMRQVRDVYSPVVIDHWQNPRNWGIMGDADGYGKIAGPCDDTMEISIKIRDGKIVKCTWDTDGCGTTIACASIASEIAVGKTIAEARKINQQVMLEYCGGLPKENEHCALLAANTLQSAIDDYLAKAAKNNELLAQSSQN